MFSREAGRGASGGAGAGIRAGTNREICPHSRAVNTIHYHIRVGVRHDEDAPLVPSRVRRLRRPRRRSTDSGSSQRGRHVSDGTWARTLVSNKVADNVTHAPFDSYAFATPFARPGYEGSRHLPRTPGGIRAVLSRGPRLDNPLRPVPVPCSAPPREREVDGAAMP